MGYALWSSISRMRVPPLRCGGVGSVFASPVTMTAAERESDPVITVITLQVEHGGRRAEDGRATRG